MMYESASQYGVLPLGSSTSSTPHPGGATNTAMSADDSYLQLGIKSKGGAEDTGSGGSTPRADMWVPYILISLLHNCPFAYVKVLIQLP